jgi:hypothetical protein
LGGGFVVVIQGAVITNEIQVTDSAQSIVNALQNAKPSHLMDHKLFNFKEL